MHSIIKVLVVLLLSGTVALLLIKTENEPKPLHIYSSTSEQFTNQARYAEKIYRLTMKDRDNRMKELYGGDPNSVIPWDGQKANYLWDLFPPSYNCPYRERIGRFSEGGKVLCSYLGSRL